jgi:hypothetical protein
MGRSSEVSTVNCDHCPEQDIQLEEKKVDKTWIKDLLLPFFQVAFYPGVVVLLYMINPKALSYS